MSERKWTKGPEWVIGIMGTDAADAHAYRRDIDADRGRVAMEDSVNARSVVYRLYEALHQLTNASDYLINRVVETKGVRCVDDTEAAIKLARAEQAAEFVRAYAEARGIRFDVMEQVA